MFKDQDDVYYYITLMNENYPHPAMPKGAEEGIRRGMYLFREGAGKKNAPARPAARVRHHPARSHRGGGASGERLRRRRRYLELPELQRTASRRHRGRTVESACIQHSPRARAMSSNASTLARGRSLPRRTICAPSPSRFGRSCRSRYVCLGTDGFGRSDYRVALRKFFEVNRHYVVVAALKSLADEGASAERRR